MATQRTTTIEGCLVLVSLLLGLGCSIPRPRVPSASPLAFDCLQISELGGAPFEVTAGDWDGDGKLDLAISSAAAGTVSTCLNHGRRSFDKAAAVAVGPLARGLAAGDMNGDGIADLVVGSADDDSVSVLLGDGQGGFTKTQTQRTGIGPFDVGVADLDGDGHLDIVVANESNATISGDDGIVSVLYGNGSGQGGPPQQLSACSRPAAVQIADLDTDGRPDLAIACWKSANVVLFLNRGERRWERGNEFTYDGDLPYGLYAADIDADGPIDLAVTDLGGSSVSILFGDGHAAFPRRTKLGVGKGVRWVAGGDLNNDKILDLATANTADDTVSILLGRGGGDFAPAQQVLVGKQPRIVSIQDLDDDGMADLAVTNMTSGTVSLLFQASDDGHACP